MINCRHYNYGVRGCRLIFNFFLLRAIYKPAYNCKLKLKD